MIINDPLAKAHSERLIQHIQQTMQNGDCIPFSDFMQLTLYAPGLGYYAAGAHKIGRKGDFITAPEISNLFSYTLARQCAEVLNELKGGDILEFGAGSGRMALAILQKLAALNCLPDHYFILDISPDLRERQRALFLAENPDLLKRVVWLDEMPEHFSGLMLANEVLDAMPVHLFHYDEKGLQEAYVAFDAGQFSWRWKPASEKLSSAFEILKPLTHAWPHPYQSEINGWLPGWINAISNGLDRGVVLLIDYGFPRHEYYLPARSMGTLMCHYQHQAHTDPLTRVGLQDITAHVDFTAVIENASQAGLTLEGYTNQASFLFNLGIHELTPQPRSPEEQFRLNQELKMLTLPSEMGELFKVMGLSKHYDGFLTGFAENDLSGRL